MRRITVAEIVHQDLADGMDFYERQEQGAGDYFAIHVRQAVRSLAHLHGIHPKRHGLFRMLVPRFPHAIFYRELPDETQVVALIDQRRDPKWIRRQLRDR